MKFIVKVYDVTDKQMDSMMFTGKDAIVCLIKWVIRKYASPIEKLKIDFIEFN